MSTIKKIFRRQLVAQTAGLLCRRLPVGNVWSRQARLNFHVWQVGDLRAPTRQTGGLRYDGRPEPVLGIKPSKVSTEHVSAVNASAFSDQEKEVHAAGRAGA